MNNIKENTNGNLVGRGLVNWAKSRVLMRDCMSKWYGSHKEDPYIIVIMTEKKNKQSIKFRGKDSIDNVVESSISPQAINLSEEIEKEALKAEVITEPILTKADSNLESDNVVQTVKGPKLVKELKKPDIEVNYTKMSLFDINTIEGLVDVFGDVINASSLKMVNFRGQLKDLKKHDKDELKVVMPYDLEKKIEVKSEGVDNIKEIIKILNDNEDRRLSRISEVLKIDYCEPIDTIIREKSEQIISDNEKMKKMLLDDFTVVNTARRLLGKTDIINEIKHLAEANSCMDEMRKMLSCNSNAELKDKILETFIRVKNGGTRVIRVGMEDNFIRLSKEVLKEKGKDVVNFYIMKCMEMCESKSVNIILHTLLKLLN